MPTPPYTGGVLPGAEPIDLPGGPVGVVLCHGFTGTTQSMRPWAEHLAALAGSRLAGVAAVAEGALSLHVGDAMPAAVGAVRSSLELSFEGGEQTVATHVTVTWQIVD